MVNVGLLISYMDPKGGDISGYIHLQQQVKASKTAKRRQHIYHMIFQIYIYINILYKYIVHKYICKHILYIYIYISNLT